MLLLPSTTLRVFTCLVQDISLARPRGQLNLYFGRRLGQYYARKMSTSTVTMAPQPRTGKRKRSAFNSEDFCLKPWAENKSFLERNYTSVDQKLHHEIIAFVEYIRPTYEEKLVRRMIFTTLQKIILGALPGGTVGMFGSIPIGLNLPKADMDISVSSSGIGARQKKSAMFRIAKKLRESGVVAEVTVNHFAPVPVVTCKTSRRYGGISVDITLNNADGLQGVAAVQKFLSEMPALRPLVLVVKSFLRQRDLHSAQTAGLGSYAVICMVISFLQLNPSLRPAEFITRHSETESLGILLRDFMLYYGVNFPYTTSYISVTEGKLLPKSSASWINTSIPNKLAIQCIVSPEVDVGRASNRIPAISGAFREAAEQLQQLTMNDSTLLGSIVALDQSTLDHRRHLHQLFCERELDESTNLGAADRPRTTKHARLRS